MLETQKGAVANRLSEKKTVIIRAAAQTLEIRRLVTCNVLFSDESPYQVFYVPNSRNDIVWGSQEENVPVASQVKFSPTVLVWMGRYGSLRIYATTFCTSAQSINSEYYINNIVKKELKPVYARLDTSGTISKSRLFTDNAVIAFSSRMVREYIHLLFREHG